MKFILNIFIFILIASNVLADGKMRGAYETTVSKDFYSPLSNTEKGYWEKVDFTDQFIVYEFSENDIYFYLHSHYMNGHDCAVEGIAKKIKNRIIYEAKGFDSRICTIEFTFDRKFITVSDPSKSCYLLFCGANGNLNLKNHFKIDDRKILADTVILDIYKFRNKGNFIRSERKIDNLLKFKQSH